MSHQKIIEDPKISVESAIAVVGSKAKIAKTLGIARASVSGWKKYVPAYQAYRLIQVYPQLNVLEAGVKSDTSM